ncbi:MAG TPA: hypothetical protein VD905_06915 [Flavobacteriales bacterium]|nr:hypothetical protein [Flavobacteriales bacterium]
MKLAGHVLPYLRGEKFSNGLEIDYNYYQTIPDRINLLKTLSTGKKIIHLGCLDHMPLIDAKVKEGKWLHQQLTDVAQQCIGVDINRDTQQYVNEKYNINNIVIADITGEPIPEITAEKWDYAILGELLEHIDNPVHFLGQIKKNYGQYVDRLIITVPNAFTVNNFKQATKSKEIINTDHRFWFTPYTLAKVVWHAGMETEEILFANRIPLSTGGLIKKKIYSLMNKPLKHNFTMASSIVSIARL